MISGFRCMYAHLNPEIMATPKGPEKKKHWLPSTPDRHAQLNSNGSLFTYIWNSYASRTKLGQLHPKQGQLF